MTAAEQKSPATRFEALYPWLLLTLCMAFWLGNWVLGRAARDAVPPVALTFGRWMVSALCLSPLALPRLKGKGALVRRHWRLIALLGFFGVFFFQVAVYTGLNYTSAINAVLMNSACPVFIVAISWFLDGDRMTPWQVVGMLISLRGIAVIITRGQIEQLLHLHFNIGDFVILLAMPAWALYCILLKWVPKSLDTLGSLFAINLAGLAFAVPALAVEATFICAPHWS
jgi:drug/metabolite transporter (DMT)-like permease